MGWLNMVKKGTIMDEFDSIKFQSILNNSISIGANVNSRDVEIELYDKNLVLTEKWDKLPVLEKIDMCEVVSAAIAANILASGRLVATCAIGVYNCEADDIDDDHKIASAFICVGQNAGILYNMTVAMPEQDFNIPLRNKITLRMVTTLNDVAAGAAFAAGNIGFDMYFNIDWVKYSTEQLKEWILKEIFIDQ
jgi:hypothetical protein